MAQVTLDIAGRRYELTVRDGQEAHFRDLAAIVDAKVRSVSGAVGTINESRQLLMAALLLADESGGSAAVPPPVPASPTPPVADESMIAVARQIDALADRLERFAQKLEKSGDNP
ncbi:cell division protein ZapA [Sphingomonas sp. BIUV-7]|uniref:Cell division protein ZapA n=1 Tax=Sphingomonas natans TaxID=3063330 RepID=A0ABT8YAY6_9SPHN|nr:cell division protein ZapA [Sphingomonas sp. BIUV-7]MDO6415502.1 cell division protein ZapA [Sphingomonas sp. BIUV-7]